MRGACSSKRSISMPTETALFVFAHQDDEYAAAAWIGEELARGRTVRCVYLTSGNARSSAQVRDAESVAVLSDLGVPRSNIAFLGGEERVDDGDLYRQMDRAVTLLTEYGATIEAPADVYVTDWEGGHPDHDAAHLVTLVAAKRLWPQARVWGFPIYNAYRCPKPLFRSLYTLPWKRARSIGYGLGRGMALAVLCRRYPSQRRTWLGLFPGAFWQRAVLRREHLTAARAADAAKRPHPGELLYERLFGVRYADFQTQTQRFVQELLEGQERVSP